MKQFFKNNTFLISMGTGIPGSRDFSLETFKKSLQMGATVISTGIALYKDQIIIKPEIYNNADQNYANTITLESLISEFPEMLFNFVLLDKNDPVIEKFCSFIKEKEILEKIIIRSVYKKNIKKIKSFLPDVACAFSLFDIIGFYALYKTGLISLKKKFLCDAIMTTEMIGTSYFASPGLINAAKKVGLKIYIMGVKNKTEIEKLSEAGVDGFLTEDIETLSNICSELNLI